MCKYCNDILECGEGYGNKDIRNKKLKFGISGKLYEYIYLACYENEENKDKYDNELIVHIYPDDPDESLIHEEIKIKYCPFCGKKLPTCYEETKLGSKKGWW